MHEVPEGHEGGGISKEGLKLILLNISLAASNDLSANLKRRIETQVRSS